ncbi:Protein scarlet [Eumeta japonica]|uniref:Protein scarlet n=1 Tax=Eumeta variegata TaxID=151549 RepID=A0A4C1TGI7_EUMVA|nr:Protein scarlet [Eumeta japonica]
MAKRNPYCFVMSYKSCPYNETCSLLEFNTNLFKNESTSVALRFNELTVWKLEEKSWFRNKGNTKTTILNEAALAGKCNLPTSGRVEVNSIPVKDVTSGFVEIVPQFEAFMDHITVAEHLYFMVEMKLCNRSNNDKAKKIMDVMKELKLKKHGNCLIRHLSGGEKRLLSTATSLLSNPKIIICDEPTTGLDVFSASLVVAALKKIGFSRAYNTMFDTSAFFRFVSVGLPCPENYNPADFYVRVLSGTAKTTQDSICEIYKSYSSQSRCNTNTSESTTSPIMSSIAIGFSFFNVTGTSQEGVQNLRGFLWLLISEVSFAMSYDALWIFDCDLTLFKREIGVYDTSAFYMSRFICKVSRAFVFVASQMLRLASGVYDSSNIGGRSTESFNDDYGISNCTCWDGHCFGIVWPRHGRSNNLHGSHDGYHAVCGSASLFVFRSIRATDDSTDLDECPALRVTFLLWDGRYKQYILETD